MQFSVEQIGNLGRRLKIEESAENVSLEVDKEIQKLKAKISLKGFRDGHVPIKIIKQKFGKDIRQDVIGKLMEKGLEEVIEKEKLEPIGMPEVENVKSETGLSFEVVLEVFPKIELIDFASIDLERETVTITDDDVKIGKERLQKQFATYKLVEDKEAILSTGQVGVIDFVGTIDGKEFEGGTGKGVKVEIGSGTFIKGFEDGIIGAKVGEERTLNLTFPKDYNSKDLAGKPAQFKVTVTGIEDKVLAPIDEEFANKLGIKKIDEVDDKIRSNMKEFVDEIIAKRLRKTTWDKLIEVNVFDLPPKLLEQEEKELNNRFKEENGKDKDCELSAEELQEVQQDAKNRMKGSLLLQKISKDYNLQPDAEKVKERIQAIANQTAYPSLIYKVYYESEAHLSNIQNSVLSDQVSDLVIESAKITDKPTSFSDVAEDM